MPIFDTVLYGKRIIGSIVGTRNDLDDTMALEAMGKTKVISIPVGLGDINGSFELMLAGKIPARHVITEF